MSIQNYFLFLFYSYRAKIVHDGSVTPDVTVLYLDFGNVDRCEKKNLREMPLELQNIPAVARRVKLGNIMPALTPDWTLQAKKQIEALIFQKPCELVVHSMVNNMKLNFEFKIISH